MAASFNKFRQSEFIRNVFTLISASSLAQAIAILIYPILSRIYSPAEHGLFALYMSVISITSIVSTGKYELAVMIPSDRRDGAGLTKLAMVIAILFSLFLLVIVLLLNKHLALWLGNPEIQKWLYFVPLSTLLVGFFQASSYWSNRHKNYKRIATANLSQSLINSAVKISTSKTLASGGGLIAGAIAGQLVGAFVYIRKMIKMEWDVFSTISRKDLQKIARRYRLFPRFNMIHYLTNNFSSSLPVFIFSSYFAPEQVGFYSLGFMMVNRPMNLFTNSFTQVFSQRVIENHHKGRMIHHDVIRLIARLFLLGLVPFIIAGIFGPGIFRVVFGNEWYEAGKYMQLLLPWLFVVLISSPLSFLPDLLLFQKKAMWIDIIKFMARFIVLLIGVFLNDIYLSLILFSGISFIMVLYNLFWYVNLSKIADRRIAS